MNKRGFTLIELVMIIVVLGILAAVAIPRYIDLTAKAKEAACKGALGALRSGIAIWYANSAVTSSSAAWPTSTELTTTTDGVMAGGTIPANPYNNLTAVTTAASGTVAGSFGWVYNTATGAIWGNTTDSSTY